MTDSLFVTGAEGFVGRRLLTRLDPAVFRRITCLDRRGRPESSPGVPRRIVGDLRDTDSYIGQLDHRTTVVHLAARTGKAPDREYFEVNVEGTRHLLAACESRGVPRFLHVSTIATTFDSVGGYPYAASKLQAEELVRTCGLDWAIVRPTIVLGPGSAALDGFRPLLRPRVVLLPGGGAVRMQPIHVDDVADALIGLARAGELGGRTHELGGPEVLTLREFLSRAHRALYGDAGPRRMPVPIEPIRGLLRLAEAVAPGLSPVHPGQLSAFFHDTVATADGNLAEQRTDLRSIETMLEAWATANGAGQPAV